MRIIPPPCQLSLLQCGLWPPPPPLGAAPQLCPSINVRRSDLLSSERRCLEATIDTMHHAWLYSDNLQTLFKRGYYLPQHINKLSPKTCVNKLPSPITKNPKGPYSTGPWPDLHGISKYANLDVKKSKRVIPNIIKHCLHVCWDASHSPHCATFMELDKMTLVCETNQCLSSAPFPQCICICMVSPGAETKWYFPG